MAKKLDQRLLDILLKYEEKPEEALWDCHGSWVAYHKAIERMAAKAGIVFSPPQIIEANSASGIVSIAVTGTMGNRSEWSFGEASPKNNKNSYPYAMAEKRAKDRVVLKLIGLHGEVYSEEESDDFKPTINAPPKSSASLKRTDENGDDAWDRLTKELDADLVDCHSIAAMSKLRADYREKAKNDRWPRAWLDALKDKFDGHEDALAAPLENDDTFPGDIPLQDQPEPVRNMAAG